MEVLGIIITVILGIISIILTIITFKLSVSVKDLKNLLLIDLYSQFHGTMRGKTFLLRNVIFKKSEKIFLDMYHDINVFIGSLIISKNKKDELKKLIIKQQLDNEFEPVVKTSGNNSKSEIFKLNYKE
jgi:hypothetical protein